MVNAGLTVIYTIFQSPSDYPGLFVVRRFYVDASGPVPDSKPLAVTKYLPIARMSIPPGLYNLGRQPGDEPQVLESWI